MPKVRFIKSVRISTKAIGLKGAEVLRTFQVGELQEMPEDGIKTLADKAGAECFEVLEEDKKITLKRKRGD